jgi:hypothetical protein
MRDLACEVRLHLPEHVIEPAADDWIRGVRRLYLASLDSLLEVCDLRVEQPARLHKLVVFIFVILIVFTLFVVLILLLVFAVVVEREVKFRGEFLVDITLWFLLFVRGRAAVAEIASGRRGVALLGKRAGSWCVDGFVPLDKFRV